MADGIHPSKEIRTALVLYGGVSLAVYENGVTRCFHDLVRRQGIFRPLLDFLDAGAIVDVVAGASAGGINGLLLAAALESGSEFKSTAKLWRRLADLGVLLGGPQGASKAESLLDGRYFHEQLIDAFKGLCRGDAGHEPGFEMDVFVAGTDVDGHGRSYRDGLGAWVRDKEHRVTFHLEHRPGRKSLGFRKRKKDVDSDLQAEVLGTIARITASFPVAFPPIREDALSEEVRSALGAASHLAPPAGPTGRSYVDGGVLDNKPFGSTLRAIFYRMPAGRKIDRRLFYVEPDPVPFVDRPREHSSIGVGLASLTSIPAHESIGDDLEQLLEHNHRVGWLRRVRDETEKDLRGGSVIAPVPQSYIQARIEALGQLLVLEGYAIPSAHQYPREERRKELLEEVDRLLTRLAGPVPGGALETLNSFDVVFHLRRAFYLLYAFDEVLDRSPENDPVRRGLVQTARIITTLKLILDVFRSRRDELIEGLRDLDAAEGAAEAVERSRRFFEAGRPHWARLAGDLGEGNLAGRLASPPQEFLSPAVLSAVADSARTTPLSALADSGPSPTILDLLGEALRSITRQCDGSAQRLDLFAEVDARLYPLEFASGVYELDRIEFARISPADAQIGLSEGDPNAKVSGDELAHFSGFLCRDWRSNDILQGRFDGICQIVRSLLTETAVEEALDRNRTIDPEVLEESVGRCPQAERDKLIGVWDEMRKRWRRDWPAEEKEAAVLELQEAFVRAGQLEAFGEDVETFFQDFRYQEVKFGRSVGPGGARAATADGLIEQDARRQARLDMEALSPAQALDAFKDAKAGSQPIVGPAGRVPNNVVGEYTTLAYLKLWGMLRVALKERARFLDRTRVRLFFRTPVLFLHHLLALMRREQATAALITAAVLGIFLGIAGMAYWVRALWVLAGTLLLLLLGMAVFAWIAGRRGRRPG